MRRVSAREAHELMEREGYVYLDVRTPAEFDAGHPRGARNVPLLTAGPSGMQENASFVGQVEALFPRTQRLIVGCQSGVRSLRAAEMLAAAGYCELVEQRAGMDGVRDAFGRVRERGWRAEGLPLGDPGED